MKYKRQKERQRVRNRDPSQGGNREGGEVSKHQETLSPVGLWGVLESQRATEYMLNCNSQWRSSPDTHIRHQQAAVLRIRTRPKRPEDNLRELT